MDAYETRSVGENASQWSESLALVNKATMRNLDKFHRTGMSWKPPRPKKGSLDNIPSAFDNKNDVRSTMFNNYLGEHSVADTLNSIDKFQNSCIARSLSPNRGRMQAEDAQFQQQRNRQKQPWPSMGLIRPAESFYFKERSNSVTKPATMTLEAELEHKTSLERAKDDLELFSRALQNNMKKTFPADQTQEYKDKLDEISTQFPIMMDEMSFKMEEMMKKCNLLQKQNTNLFERTATYISDETLRISLERQRQEFNERLLPLEKYVRDLMVQTDNIKYEVDNKIAERLNKFQSGKTDNASEILHLKNDLYGFIDNKLTHHSSIMEKRVDTLNAFCNEHDLRLKKLIGYKDEIEMKLEETNSTVNVKLMNLSKTEQQVENKSIEMRRAHQEVMTKLTNFELVQDTLRSEVETQLEIMKNNRFQESQLKKIVLDVLSPRDKIERNNIKKYNKLFRGVEAKINGINRNQQSLREIIQKHSQSITSLESNVLSTFHEQIEQMKKIQDSPSKITGTDPMISQKMLDIEERISEKSNQTLAMFDTFKEEIHTEASAQQKALNTKISKIQSGFGAAFEEVKKICLDKLDTIDQKLALERDFITENKQSITTLSLKFEELEKILKELKTIKPTSLSEKGYGTPSTKTGLAEDMTKPRPNSSKPIPTPRNMTKINVKDSTEVLFETEEEEKNGTKKEVMEITPKQTKEKPKQDNLISRNFNVVDSLPEIESQDSSSQQKNTDESLSVVGSITHENLDDELKPLPSSSEVERKNSFERTDSLEKVFAYRKRIQEEQKTKSQPPEKRRSKLEDKMKMDKPAYSFLGLSSGGLNKPKKAQNDYSKMKRNEFQAKNQLRCHKEGDDYYFSLKENQFCISEKILDKETNNAVHISNRERKERIYSQKYLENLDRFYEFVFITNLQSKFTIETECDNFEEEPDEAIIFGDSSDEEEEDAGKSLLSHFTSISSASKINTDSSPFPGHKDTKSFKSFKTYELSEDGQSQVPSKRDQKEPPKRERMKRNNHVLEVNIDEDTEEEDDDSVSNIDSPASRFGFRKQPVELQKEQDVNSFTKLSRKPKNFTTNPVEESKQPKESIEVSDLESSANSFDLASNPKTALMSFKNKAAQNKGDNLEAKVATNNNLPNNFSEVQKTEILNHLESEWVSQEITNCMLIHNNKK
ncbi:unnamed protein product [Moneuplotes crassus]|uniref:Uncharacterized protein n=1 Tax=Euplotes crassus TaxID=5936 RepID=A0AAD1UM45_EUPCR|nr:unnamed protein product [Moneuplotes crassus]